MLLLAGMLNPRKPFTRLKNPPRVYPTKSTEAVLAGIHDHEGVMSLEQITRRFFPGCSSTWPWQRMTALYDNHYVGKHDASIVNGERLGAIVFTLLPRGAVLAARAKGVWWPSFRWRTKPKWISLSHDLAINDFRISVTEAAIASPSINLHHWISEYELSKAHPRIPGRLDGFFVLHRSSLTHPGWTDQLVLLPEIDKGNHPIGRFIRRKVKPSIGYIGSSAYQKLFKVSSGTVLVVTTGPRRLANLKAATERAGGAGLFYFTTFEQLSADTVLAKPVWQLAGSRRLFSIEELPLSPVDAGVLDEVPGLRPVQASLLV